MKKKKLHQLVFEDTLKKIEEASLDLRKKDFINSCKEAINDVGLSIDLDCENNFECIPKSPGIYCFWIKLENWINNNDFDWDKLIVEFCDDWEKPTESIKCYPKVNNKNLPKMLKEFSNEEWIPLYIGKSKNINQRVTQHVNLEAHKKTYALKLKSRKNCLKGVELEVTTIPFEVSEKSYFVISLIEQLIRNSYHPIIGK